jgi:pyruvate formate lyase activating enzyme
MTAGEVTKEVLKDEVFYVNSGGGVTLSGGEPLAQADFSVAILKDCREKGLHTAVETAGHVGWPHLEKVISCTDLFLYDLKHLDPEIHEQCVGVSNKIILSNLEKLAGSGKEIVVRTPIVPDFNDRIENVEAISDHVSALGIRELHLLPFHRYGKGKYRLLGRECPYPECEETPREKLEQLKHAAEARGLKVVIGG